MSDETKKTHEAMSSTTQENSALEHFFTAARNLDKAPDAALMDRILRDAALEQDSFQIIPTRARRKLNPLARVSEMLGGWSGVSALTICAATGLIVGFSTPGTIASYSFGVVSSEVASDLEFNEYFGLGEFSAENE